MKRAVIGGQQSSQSHTLLYDNNDPFYGSCLFKATRGNVKFSQMLEFCY